MRNLRSIFRADRKAIQEGSSYDVGVVGIIHRKEDPVGANNLQCAKEWGQRKTAARGDIEVFVKILGDAALEVPCTLPQEFVSTDNVVRQCFTHVPDNDLELGKAVEQTGNNHTQAMHSGFDMPPPACSGKEKSHIAG